jgi:hypothetical protein
VARNRREQSTLIRSARRGSNHWLRHEEGFVFIIGIDPHKGSQLVAAGETVLDVPPTLSARVRLLDAGCTDKTDPHDARAAAIVALRHSGRRRVTPMDHTAVCVCWPIGTTTSPDCEPRRSADSP